ncbi:hypothetical protein D3C87_1672700 [compost metagenome]
MLVAVVPFAFTTNAGVEVGLPALEKPRPVNTSPLEFLSTKLPFVAISEAFTASENSTVILVAEPLAFADTPVTVGRTVSSSGVTLALRSAELPL